METAVRERFERIEAILDGVAKKQAAAEARMERSDARFEKRMRGFENLARIGMKEIAKLRQLNHEGDQKLNALIDAQQRTEASLRAFLDSMRKGGNGHSGKSH